MKFTTILCTVCIACLVGQTVASNGIDAAFEKLLDKGITTKLNQMKQLKNFQISCSKATAGLKKLSKREQRVFGGGAACHLRDRAKERRRMTSSRVLHRLQGNEPELQRP